MVEREALAESFIDREVAVLKDERHLATDAEKDETRARRAVLEAGRAGLRRGVGTVADLDRSLAPLLRQREVFIGARETVSNRLLEIGSTPRREQEREYEALSLALRNIDYGCDVVGGITMLSPVLGNLLRAAGYAPPDGSSSVWDAVYGSLPEIEERIETLEQKRTEAQRALDALLAQFS